MRHCHGCCTSEDRDKVSYELCEDAPCDDEEAASSWKSGDAGEPGPGDPKPDEPTSLELEEGDGYGNCDQAWVPGLGSQQRELR